MGVDRFDFRIDTYKENNESPFKDVTTYYEKWIKMDFVSFIREGGYVDVSPTIKQIIQALQGVASCAELFDVREILKQTIKALSTTLHNQTQYQIGM